MAANTYKQLEEAPDPESPEFMGWLREHNVVVFHEPFFTSIENCKYHSKEYPHHTVFVETHAEDETEMTDEERRDIAMIKKRYQANGFMNLENREVDKSIKRFHIHFLKDLDHYTEERKKWLSPTEDVLQAPVIDPVLPDDPTLFVERIGYKVIDIFNYFKSKLK